MSKKKQFQLEFIIKSSPNILWDFIYTPSGLANWFADNVDTKQNEYAFTWNGSTDHATMIHMEEHQYVKYRWDYMAKDEFFEFRIRVSEISKEVILVVTDFADPKEIKDQSLLWESQIKSLKQHLGA